MEDIIAANITSTAVNNLKADITPSNDTITVTLPKPEIPRVVEDMIASLTSMQATQGWAIMVKILNDNIAYLEKAILEKIDPVSKAILTDAEVEILRVKRNLNIDLRDTPQTYSKVVREAGEVPEEYDPYFQTNDEIKKAKQNPPQDDKGK